jgi:hypothetical protein
MYIPMIEYNEINNKAIPPVTSDNSVTGNMLTESRDFLLFSHLYIAMALGRCLMGHDESGQVVAESWSFYDKSFSLINEVPPIPAHWIGMAMFHLFRAIYLM